MTIDINAINFLDETVREGDARGYHFKAPAERIELMARIHEVTGILDYCIGWCVAAKNDADTLRAFIDASKSGLLPGDAVGHIFHFFQTQPQLDALLNSIPDQDRAFIAVDFATVASDEIAPILDGPWLASQSGDPEWLHATPVHELHRQLAGCAGERVAGLRRWGLHHVGLIVQDAFRCRYEALRLYVEAAVGNGASVIRLHDTVGVATPSSTIERLGKLLADFPETQFYCHFHNDFGMAGANAVTAITHGAAGVDVTVNGVGNRAGNACTAEVLMALKVIHGIEFPQVKYEHLCELSRTVERYFGLLSSLYAPVTGRLLYVDEASLRTHQIENISATSWLPYAPRDVGGRMEAAHTVVSGRNAIALLAERHKEQLSFHGIDVDDAFIERAHAWCHSEQLRRAARHRPRILALQDVYESELRQSYVTDADVLRAAKATQGRFDS